MSSGALDILDPDRNKSQDKSKLPELPPIIEARDVKLVPQLPTVDELLRLRNEISLPQEEVPPPPPPPPKSISSVSPRLAREKNDFELTGNRLPEGVRRGFGLVKNEIGDSIQDDQVIWISNLKAWSNAMKSDTEVVDKKKVAGFRLGTRFYLVGEHPIYSELDQWSKGRRIGPGQADLYAKIVATLIYHEYAHSKEKDHKKVYQMSLEFFSKITSQDRAFYNAQRPGYDTSYLNRVDGFFMNHVANHDQQVDMKEAMDWKNDSPGEKILEFGKNNFVTVGSFDPEIPDPKARLNLGIGCIKRVNGEAYIVTARHLFPQVFKDGQKAFMMINGVQSIIPRIPDRSFDEFVKDDVVQIRVSDLSPEQQSYVATKDLQSRSNQKLNKLKDITSLDAVTKKKKPNKFYVWKIDDGGKVSEVIQVGSNNATVNTDPDTGSSYLVFLETLLPRGTSGSVVVDDFGRIWGVVSMTLKNIPLKSGAIVEGTKVDMLLPKVPVPRQEARK